MHAHDANVIWPKQLQHRTRVSYQRFRKREWIATIQIRRAIEPDRTCSSISLRVIYRDLCCTKLSAQLMTLGELCANDYRCGDRAKVRPGGASAKCDTSIIRKGKSLRGSLAHLEQRASPSPVSPRRLQRGESFKRVHRQWGRHWADNERTGAVPHWRWQLRARIRLGLGRSSWSLSPHGGEPP